MYVPPRLKNSQRETSAPAPKWASFSRTDREQSVVVPVERIVQKEVKELKIESKEVKIYVPKEKPTEDFSRPNDFWYDIYDGKSDPSEQSHLVWNHSITKESMVKLLQEQGTIKFNPIGYYRNTIESQESAMKQVIDKLTIRIIHSFITYLKDFTIHSIQQTHIDHMIHLAEEIISNVSSLSESEKITMVESYQTKLQDFLKTKSPELANSLGFKYKQQIGFLEDAIEGLEDEKKMEGMVKQVVTDKLKKLIIECVLSDKQVLMKEFISLDKVIKKEFKTLSSLSCDSKYTTRLVAYNIIHSFLDKESEKNKKIKTAVVDSYFDKIEKVENIIRARLYPYLDIATDEKITTFEKELDLFEYSSMKDKIIGEKQDSELERHKKHDASVLEQIEKHTYEQPVVFELAHLVHSIEISANVLPYMIRMLEFFTKNINSPVQRDVMNSYLETYTYIVDYIQSHQQEFNKLPADKKKMYSDMVERSKKLLEKEKVDLYEYQLTYLYECLSPLSHFDEKRPKLDPWQKHVFELMDHRKNVIVIAPTSSGKTALSTYCSLIVNKALFVVPSSELARQVCGMIRNLVIDNKLKKHISLLTEKDTYHDQPDQFDIMIGTPASLEMYFVENNIEPDMFQYIVFDEIHQLNQEVVGAELERWIKLLTYQSKSKFLALSACVGNADVLHKWWKQFVDDIELVVCNRRFLQQQKFLWSDEKGALDKIHPLTVCSLTFLQEDGFIHNGVVRSDVAFTPDDLYHLYAQLKNHPAFDPSLHPNQFFPSIRLSLENCKEWEWKIKTMLQSLSRSDPAFVQSMLDKYGYGLEETIRESTVEDLYRLLKDLQQRSLLPAILFRLNPGVCQEKFTQLVHYLKEEESRVYPYYYDDLNFLKEFYDSLAEEDKELENITIPDNIGSPHLYIEDRKKKLRSAKLAEYQKKGVDHFKSRILYNKNRIQENGDDEILEKQIKYYEKQIFKIRRQVEVVSINVYKPHPDFTFLEEHVSTEHIIDYRRQLMDYLREEKKSQIAIEKMNHTYVEDSSKEKDEMRKETYVSYDHPFMIGMERGVILYLNRLPTPFQRVAQSLIASTMKLAPVTFSDQSLAFGINYPIRSVILTGGYIHPIIAHQMIGRAGRRGIDPKGYTIYYGVDWRTIMKEKYLEVEGCGTMDGTIWSMPYLWTNLEDKFELVSQFHLKDFTSGTEELGKRYENFMEEIQKINYVCKEQYHTELVEDGVYEYLFRDIYRNKHLGFQSVFLPYLLEEMSRWKFVCNQLDAYIKWDIIQLMTCFLNGDLRNNLFSETFRKKIQNWYEQIGDIIDTYCMDRKFVPCHLEDKLTENTIPYWFAICNVLSSLHSLCKERRIKTLVSVLFLEIKNRLKKHTF